MSFSIKSNKRVFTTSTYSPPPSVYGSFSSTQTQDLSANQVLRLTYNTEDISASGVFCTLPSPNIYVRSTGVYKVLASLQCDNQSGGNRTINMWISIDGVGVPNSATRVVINNAIESLMTVEWFINLNAGQYISIDLLSTGSNTRALAINATGSVPAIPSIITTIVKIG